MTDLPVKIFVDDDFTGKFIVDDSFTASRNGMAACGCHVISRTSFKNIAEPAIRNFVYVTCARVDTFLCASFLKRH